MDFIGVCLVLHQWHHVVLFSWPNTRDTWKYITLDTRTKEHNFWPFCSSVKKIRGDIFLTQTTRTLRLRSPSGRQHTSEAMYVSAYSLHKSNFYSAGLCVNLRRLREKNLCVLCVFAWDIIITLIKKLLPLLFFCQKNNQLIKKYAQTQVILACRLLLDWKTRNPEQVGDLSGF